MKVIFEEIIGRLVQEGFHFKLFGRNYEHGEPHNMPYLLLTEHHVGEEERGHFWSVIQRKDNATAIRTVINRIDALCASSPNGKSITELQHMMEKVV